MGCAFVLFVTAVKIYALSLQSFYLSARSPANSRVECVDVRRRLRDVPVVHPAVGVVALVHLGDAQIAHPQIATVVRRDLEGHADGAQLAFLGVGDDGVQSDLGLESDLRRAGELPHDHHHLLLAVDVLGGHPGALAAQLHSAANSSPGHEDFHRHVHRVPALDDLTADNSYDLELVPAGHFLDVREDAFCITNVSACIAATFLVLIIFLSSKLLTS